MADELIPLEDPFQGRVRSEADLKGTPGREVELQEVGGILQWRYAGEVDWLNLFDTSVLAGANGLTPDFRVTDAVLEHSYDGATWAPLFDLGTLAGANGREVQIQASTTHIQWRYAGEVEWTNIVSLVALAGADGRNVELQKSATQVQWRLAGDVEWIDIIALSDLKGDPGPAIEMQRGTTHLQWRVVGDATWIDLIALSELKGDPGEEAVLPADNVTGTGITHIAAVTEYPATEDPETLYILVPA